MSVNAAGLHSHLLHPSLVPAGKPCESSRIRWLVTPGSSCPRSPVFKGSQRGYHWQAAHGSQATASTCPSTELRQTNNKYFQQELRPLNQTKNTLRWSHSTGESSKFVGTPATIRAKGSVCQLNDYHPRTFHRNPWPCIHQSSWTGVLNNFQPWLMRTSHQYN